MDVRITDDLEFATQVMTHPAIWPALTNDAVPPLPEFQAPPNFVYFVALEDDQPAGLFGLQAIEPNVVSMHAAMLPQYRGKGTNEASAKLLGWIWEHTPAERVVVRLEARNVLARAAAVKAGFRECERWTDGTTQAGRPMQMIEMEVCRGLSC